MTTANLSRFFAPSVKSPEGKTWAQNLFLNAVADKPNHFKGDGTTDNGNKYLVGVNLNDKTSEKGVVYSTGYFKEVGEEKLLSIALFPSHIETFPSLKYKGSISSSVGEGDARVSTKVADVDLVEFTNKKGELGYQLRLKPVYVPEGATATETATAPVATATPVAQPEPELATAGGINDFDLPFWDT